MLEQPARPEEGLPHRFVVFGILGEGARLSKSVLAEENGALRSDGFETYRLDLESARFLCGGDAPGAARLVTMALRVRDTRKTPRGPRLHQFSAAPRSLEERP